MLFDVSDWSKFTQSRLFGRVLMGTVIDNADPEGIGAVRCNIAGLTDGIQKDYMPWITKIQYNPTGGAGGSGGMDVPQMGSTLTIEFPDGTLENAIWTGYWESKDTMAGDPADLPDWSTKGAGSITKSGLMSAMSIPITTLESDPTADSLNASESDSSDNVDLNDGLKILSMLSSLSVNSSAVLPPMCGVTGCLSVDIDGDRLCDFSSIQGECNNPIKTCLHRSKNGFCKCPASQGDTGDGGGGAAKEKPKYPFIAGHKDPSGNMLKINLGSGDVELEHGFSGAKVAITGTGNIKGSTPESAEITAGKNITFNATENFVINAKNMKINVDILEMITKEIKSTAPKWTQTGPLTVTKNITSLAEIQDKYGTMSEIRTIYNGHEHRANGEYSNTNPPNEKMPT